MTEEIKPALSAEEWVEREFDSFYGVARTSFSIDHKGRIFVHDERPNRANQTLILNEAADAPEITRKVATLCMAHAAESRETLGDDHDAGRRYAWAFTRKDVALLQDAVSAVLVAGEDWHVGPDEYAQVKRDMASLRALAARIAALLPPEGA